MTPFRNALRKLRCRDEMMPLAVRLLICFFVTYAAVASGVAAAVKSASSDGEATVYVTGTFSKDFDLAYRAVLKPGSRNKSWSTLSILLVGNQIPGPGATVGLVSNTPSSRTLRPFTYVIYPNATYKYQNYRTNCRAGCILELRGDEARIYAYVNGVETADWSRSDLYLQHPYIQLNAEAHGKGDTLNASLTPVRVLVAGHSLHRPNCAFTTRGIEAAGLNVITFHGTTNDASGAFVNLSTSTHGSKC